MKCQQCGKEGAKKYQIIGREFWFCSDFCKEEYGRSLYRKHEKDIHNDILRGGGSVIRF